MADAENPNAENPKGNPKLVAATGMTYQDVKARSTLDIGEGAYDHAGQYAARDRSFRDVAVFDWHLPGGALVFPGCRYYSLRTAPDDDPRLISLWVTTAPDKLSWDQLIAQMYDVRRRLHEDGWKPAHYNTEGRDADDLLTEMLQRPAARADGWDGNVGGVTYGKGNAALSLSAKRLSPAPPGRSPYGGAEFIHYVEMDRRAEWEKTYDYDGGIKLPW